MTTEQQIKDLQRQVKKLEERLNGNFIPVSMSTQSDTNAYRAVQRALVSNPLTIGSVDQVVPNTSSVFTMNANKKGFILPRTTTLEDVESPVEGMMIYDYDREAVQVYNGTSWGMTLPRTSNPQMLAIATPMSGQMVYNKTHDGPEWYDGTRWGFILPTVSTSQRNSLASPVRGQMVFNISTDKLNVYANGAWEEITST